MRRATIAALVFMTMVSLAAAGNASANILLDRPHSTCRSESRSRLQAFSVKVIAAPRSCDMSRMLFSCGVLSASLRDRPASV